jgi:undecaprenyl pyrophosphate phosphatase UppP
VDGRVVSSDVVLTPIHNISSTAQLSISQKALGLDTADRAITMCHWLNARLTLTLEYEPSILSVYTVDKSSIDRKQHSIRRCSFYCFWKTKILGVTTAWWHLAHTTGDKVTSLRVR